MPNKECELWMTIQDIIGAAKLWPYRIRRLFWTQHIKHWDRILICVFVFVNGLNPEIFFEWATLKNLCRDRSAENHIRYLLRTFENNPQKYTWYAWNVSRGHYETLGGQIVKY